MYGLLQATMPPRRTNTYTYVYVYTLNVIPALQELYLPGTDPHPTYHVILIDVLCICFHYRYTFPLIVLYGYILLKSKKQQLTMYKLNTDVL